jgi:hypothetical protein
VSEAFLRMIVKENQEVQQDKVQGDSGQKEDPSSRLRHGRFKGQGKPSQ